MAHLGKAGCSLVSMSTVKWEGNRHYQKRHSISKTEFTVSCNFRTHFAHNRG
jgi:hypothetical protein